MDATDDLLRILLGRFDPESLNEPGNWEKLAAAAEREGVASLVAFGIRTQITGEPRKWCDEVLTRSWILHDRRLRILKQTADRLETAGLRFLALKGPVLAARYYSPPFLKKTSGDLDLALGETDLEAACAVLAPDGYAPACSLTRARRTSHHVVLTHPSKPRIELHFRLSHGPSGAPAECFLDRSIRYRYPDGFSIRIPDPADELMHLVLHMVQDRFLMLFHFFEVWKLWNASTPEIRNEAVRRGVANRFAGVFALADVAFRCRLGEPLIRENSPLPRTWLDRRINERLYRAMREGAMLPFERTLPGRLRGRWLELQTTDGPSDALRRLACAFQTTRYALRSENG